MAALFAFAAGPLRAQDASLEEAKAHAARAKVHYDLGEYEKAAEEYILVYRIRPLAPLLYNIAQSYRQAGQYEKAKQFYKSYLRESKDATASNRAAIEKAIREIEELQAKERRAKDGPPKGIAQTPAVTGGAPTLAPPAAAPAPQTPERTAVAESLKPPAGPPVAAPAVATAQAATAAARTALPAQAVTTTTVAPSRGKDRTFAYVTAGAAALFIGGGLVFTSRASKFEDELTARPHPQSTIDDLSSTAKSSRTLGALFLGAGAAAAIGAGLLYFLPTGDGVAVQGRF
ncbi:MAG TPA: tetratricopeptide repeat protein [Myxococcales bacterium]|nr:tetratricopeptide repeat protein [Myxococcales bacterium]